MRAIGIQQEDVQLVVEAMNDFDEDLSGKCPIKIMHELALLFRRALVISYTSCAVQSCDHHDKALPSLRLAFCLSQEDMRFR